MVTISLDIVWKSAAWNILVTSPFVLFMRKKVIEYEFTYFEELKSLKVSKTRKLKSQILTDLSFLSSCL